MSRVSNGLIAGAAVGLIAGGCAALMSNKKHKKARLMKRNAAKAMKTFNGLLNDVACMIH